VFEKCTVAIVASLAIWRYGKAGVHKFYKKSRGHLQTLGSERWHEASSILRIYNYLAPLYKIKLLGRLGDEDFCTPGVRIMITDITLCQPLPFVQKKHIFLIRDSKCVSVAGIHRCDGITARSCAQHELDLLDAASVALCSFLLLRLQWAYNSWRCFIIFAVHKSGYQIKDDKRGTCSTHERDENCVHLLL
jgi:hypothetical protein